MRIYIYICTHFSRIFSRRARRGNARVRTTGARVGEKTRARTDGWNPIVGGCVTGGVLAASAGPQAMAMGCAGFAAFSAAIDALGFGQFD